MWKSRAFHINPDFEKKYPVERGKIPNSKHQAPNKYQIPNKFQNSKSKVALRLSGFAVKRKARRHGGMEAGSGLGFRGRSFELQAARNKGSAMIWLAWFAPEWVAWLFEKIIQVCNA